MRKPPVRLRRWKALSTAGADFSQQPARSLLIGVIFERFEYRCFGGAGIPTQGEDMRFTLDVDFVDAVTAKRAPLVTGQDGRRALALATQIAKQIADANAS